MKKTSSTTTRVTKLRRLAAATASAATEVTGNQEDLRQASQTLSAMAHRIETQVAPAILELPVNATAEEVRTVRRRQSVKHGTEVYLPSWTTMARGLPNALLRSALFATTRSVQAANDKILAGEDTLLVANKTIATLNNVTITLSGYELCQFDRQVYAACLDYYRERPLAPEGSSRGIQTTFYELAQQLGCSYSVRLHKAIRASLLRLSFCQLRLRINRLNLEVPKLLSASFEDGESSLTGYKASDQVFLRVTESVAELFGPGSWAAVDTESNDYDGLKGWLACFYASHSGPQWLPLETLNQLSGYGSRADNFKISLKKALDKLTEKSTPDCTRVAHYRFSEDGAKILVTRVAWAQRQLALT